MEKHKQFFIKVRAIILHEGKMLVVQHPGYNAKLAAFPGGHLEYGEDVKECLAREMVEELGVKPEIGKLLYINKYTEGEDKQYIEFFFEVKNGTDYLNSEKLVRSHSFELIGIIWANPTDDITVMPKAIGEDFKAGKVISDEVRYIKD